MTSLDIYWATPAVFWPDSEAWVAAQKRELQDFARAQNTDLHVLSPIDTALEQKCCVDESIFLSNVAMVQQAAAKGLITKAQAKSIVEGTENE